MSHKRKRNEYSNIFLVPGILIGHFPRPHRVYHLREACIIFPHKELPRAIFPKGGWRGLCVTSSQYFHLRIFKGHCNLSRPVMCVADTANWSVKWSGAGVIVTPRPHTLLSGGRWPEGPSTRRLQPGPILWQMHPLGACCNSLCLGSSACLYTNVCHTCGASTVFLKTLSFLFSRG